MHVVQSDAGWVEVVCGPMFSGKTEELLRRVRRAQIARQRVQIFKPVIDDRYHKTQIVSHSAVSMEATVVKNVEELAASIDESTQVVAIDEIQFFDVSVVALIDRLAVFGKRVICAGLDLDFAAEPFGPMPEILASAEYVTKTLAICMRCGSPAARSQRFKTTESSAARNRKNAAPVKTTDGAQVQVGAAEAYEARCRRCHVPRPVATTDRLFDSSRPISAPNTPVI